MLPRWKNRDLQAPLSFSFNHALTQSGSPERALVPQHQLPLQTSQKRLEGPQSDCWLFPLPPNPSWQVGHPAQLIWPLEGASFCYPFFPTPDHRYRPACLLYCLPAPTPVSCVHPCQAKVPPVPKTLGTIRDHQWHHRSQGRVQTHTAK